MGGKPTLVCQAVLPAGSAPVFSGVRMNVPAPSSTVVVVKSSLRANTSGPNEIGQLCSASSADSLTRFSFPISVSYTM